MGVAGRLSGTVSPFRARAGLGSGCWGSEEHYGLWGCSGDPWEGLEQEGLPRGSATHPISPPSVAHHPWTHTPHLLHPVPWSHPPSRLRKLPCCPFYPSTPSVFLLRMPGGSRPATSAPNHLLSLDCCAPSEQSALWRLLIPPLSLQTLQIGRAHV